MSPAEIGKEIGVAIKTGGPWVIMALAIAGVVTIAVMPSARADPFTGTQAAALEDRFEANVGTLRSDLNAHTAMYAHIGAGKKLSELEARVINVENLLKEIRADVKTILARGR